MPIGHFLDKNHRPDEMELRAALGDAFPFWQRLVQFIQDSYELSTDLSYGGRNYGWNLWYRKSSKALTSLYPAQGHLVALVVLGKLELEKATAESWAPTVTQLLQDSPRLHDGCWLWVPVKSAAETADVERLLLLKRKPVRKKM
jgi:hypothetical protein